VTSGFVDLVHDSPRRTVRTETADASPNGRFWIFEGYASQKKFGFTIPKKPSSVRNLRHISSDASIKMRMPPFKVKQSIFELFDEERDAFLRMKDILIGDIKYARKFVAIHKGNVIGFDESKKELAKRVYAEHGYIPIYIGKVEKERTTGEMSSPERV